MELIIASSNQNKLLEFKKILGDKITLYNLSDYNSLGYIKSLNNHINFNKVIKDFNSVFIKNDKSLLLKVLKKYVPNFSHINLGKNLDEKLSKPSHW